MEIKGKQSAAGLDFQKKSPSINLKDGSSDYFASLNFNFCSRGEKRFDREQIRWLEER